MNTLTKIGLTIFFSLIYWGYFFFLALMAFNAGASKGMSFWAGSFFGGVYVLVLFLSSKSLKE